ncbi:putative translocation and assembly module TamB [Helianthus annuus]|uniref:Translocation and assembly module TamB n=1 Tax=Helianthus annuus TaxID=4232 RepID=A0A251U4J7_HELAN|nr:protein TIC236, chloroplastic [Helianthus annuus]KAF5779089.1 putative translocation and assembly module TamB [Helianthus annuus]KAJ0490409.1 putative translocation and assembly module TamB [Helianthus annuus]KAJ0494604.1 putative translocation and assembly module TamB [Helianthus annuus]KAJ0506327.1 putative translocation and assembly module TamB [Helianthus annuus]KAJ0676000.1 putative translocation and assembly module TamB [Helianthus annuus]
MSNRLLYNPFVGGPFPCTFKQKLVKSKPPRKACLPHAKKHDWISHGIRYCGENVEILWKNIGLRSGFVVKSVKAPFARNKTLVRSLETVWAEGLFVFRCSVFCAVVSGVCLLLWYGQRKAKTLVESKLLPSVCTALSGYIQRDLHFGKVRSISPLSITLESCSIGPHKEEFSCGEVPTLKLRFQPFSSLRRGKIVIDAVLCNPTLLVAQKRNYSWLGIPFTDAGVLQKHLSTEEGIDNRTRTRRIAREETAARMNRERDDAALEAAKTGYVISNNEVQGEGGHGDVVNKNVFSMDEKLRWQDHHCMDAGVEYDMKHADLEKSFGVNTPVAGVKFWSPGGPLKRKRRKVVNDTNDGIAAKEKILEQSASAALAFFLDPSLVDKKDENQIRESYSHNQILQDADPEISGLERKSLLEDEDMDSKQQLSSSFQGSTYANDRGTGDLWSSLIVGPIQKIKSLIIPEVENIVGELVEGANEEKTVGIEKMVPIILDSVHFKGGTLLLLAYGDNEPREMENASGHVKFQNNYSRVHVQLSGNCKMWRSDVTSEDGGWLSTDVFVDILEQKWHANLKVVNLFAPLFERILELPIAFYEGRASGEVHICMSEGESFPNLHGQLDVTGLAFQIFDAPSSFSDISASLCFRAQRIFLHNASGWFGKVPLEASGDFGIEPEEGEFHLMCQVPSVEVNDLMKSFKMKPLLFPLAGCVTAVFNCQGPLDAPVFVGSGLVSRKMSSWVADNDVPTSAAYDAILKNKEAGAVAAFDRVPLSYVSANFTFNTDNCVADLYGIRATLVDGGEIRGAGNAWICPEGEVDDTAMDVNFSGSLCFDKIMDQYVPGYNHLIPFKLGDLNGETKLSGSLLKPRFDIKWTAPKAEGSFGDARGDMIISHEFITISSSSVAFELFTKVETSYPYENWLDRKELAVIIEGVELDLRMRGFEIFNLVSSSFAFDSLRPIHLKTTGRIKFQGKVVKPAADVSKILAGDVSITGLKLNQLLLAPQLAGQLKISPDCIKLDATGRADESLAVEVSGPLQSFSEDNIIGTKLSFSLLKGQLRANAFYQPFQSINLEVRHLPLDELELASLRGMLQRAEVQINFEKRRGHGILSLLHPKFSGVLGEALDLAARWSGDVITVEKAALKQSNSEYELQGEYVLPGSRDGKKERRRRGSDIGSVISSMGRWRMRLEVPRAEIAEMLPLARLVSRTTDPALQFRSKDLFMQSIQSVGIAAESLQKLLEEIRGHSTPTDEVILEELNLPGLAELKGRWGGSLDASGGGNGDTMAEFDFQGEEWEWGAYKTQRVLAAGAYSNDDGLRLEKMFIQRDNATIHADGTLLGPKTNLHFAVLNFPVSLVPTLVQVLESSANEAAVHSLRQLLAPIKGILYMEGDLRGSLAKPECDVQVRLLDGAIGGIDLGRAEIVASLTSTSRFLFNAKFEPIIQNGHVHVQGSIPLNILLVQDEENLEKDDKKNEEASWAPWGVKGKNDDKKAASWNEQGWDTQLAESLKGLHWNVLDVGEVRVDADVKDGGMMLLTALSPYANWLNGSAEVMLQVRGTVEQPIVDGSASFHRATISSPILRQPLTNFGGIILMDSNRLCIRSLESRVSRKGKLSVKGNLPLRTTEASLADKIDLKCEVLEVRAKNMLSGQVDSELQVTGSILQPNISGNIKLSHGEAYLPHEKGAAAMNREASDASSMPTGGYNQVVASKYVSRFLNLKPTVLNTSFQQPSGKEAEVVVKKGTGHLNSKPKLDIRLTDLKLVLGPELRIVYPLILNFAVSGELELNGVAHPKLLKPKGVLMFENGDVNLVATQVRLKREHLNTAKFEADYGLDPMLDLALVGSEWQFRIQSRATKWQDSLVVTSTRSVEQDVLSPSEAARVFESQLAESILEGDGQLAFKKLATATLETLMPRIEGKGEFGHARWRLVYAPQIPSLLSVDPTVDPLKSLASNISFGTEVEVQLGKRLQASVVRQMKDSEMAMQWTLIYQLTSRLRLLLQSAPSKRMLFEYSTTSQD